MSTALLSALLCLPAVPAQEPDAWPHLRGATQDGRAQGHGLFDRERAGLAIAWRTPLGPGYSGVAVAEGVCVTLFSDGTKDVIAGFDQESGRENWRTFLGPTYLGHDGSEDGPIGSPVIGDGNAFAVGPRGALISVRLSNGELRWRKELGGEFGSEAPEYGYSTTPLLENGVLIVQVGGSEGRALCGFEPASGDLLWSAGTGTAGYQSPTVMELAGERQVLCLNNQEIFAVDPATGVELWKHTFEGARESARSGVASAIDGERFFAFVSSALTTFRVTRSSAGFAVEELYRSRELGSTYATPIYHDGYLYGFRGDFLTCVHADTGKRVWKSRPPGGRGLIIVDDRLVIFGAEGVLSVARATPAGFEEELHKKVLEYSSFSWPAFASGRIFLRNSAELASVEIVSGAGPLAKATETTRTEDHLLGRLEGEIAALGTDEQKRARVDAFLAAHESFPILEGDRVHFLYRGDVEDVAIEGPMLETGKPAPLQRIAGTDLYFKTYTIEPGARFEYRFQIDYDNRLPDALNPRQVPSSRGEPMSEVLTPGYVEATHYLDPTGTARGKIDSFDFKSEQLENERKISVYLPPDYERSEETYPLLLVQQGSEYLEKGAMANSLDNLIGDTVRPVVVVFVGTIGMWWLESGGTNTERYMEMLATELIPYLESRYRLSSRPEDRALMGKLGFGLTAAYGPVLMPEVFGKCAVQSVRLGDVAEHAFFKLLRTSPRRDITFYVDWNRYEARNPDRAYDHGADARRLVAALQAKGYTIKGGEALDSHGWGGWRTRTSDILEALFPLAPQ